MGKILNVLLKNRAAGTRSVCVYLNAGDPDIDTTEALIALCEKKGVDLIELGVPFANSFTDGQSVIRSHERALANQTQLETVVAMVSRLRQHIRIPMVLLADFSHTIKPRGLEYFIRQAQEAGIDSLLLHGLPPLYMEEYLQLTQDYGMAPVFSLYPNSKPQAIAQSISNTRSFIYLVSQYGRTGSPVNFHSTDLLDFHRRLRTATDLPLLAGFGIKDQHDLQDLFSNSPVDGAIIGSAISRIIENCLGNSTELFAQVEDYLDQVIQCKHIPYPPQYYLEAEREHTA